MSKSKKNMIPGKFINLPTVIGTLGDFTHLNNPSKEYRTYDFKVILNPNDPKVKEFVELIKSTQEEYRIELADSYPNLKVVGMAHTFLKVDPETGNYVLKLQGRGSGKDKATGKSKAEMLPLKFDAKSRPLGNDVYVTNGSTVAVKISLLTSYCEKAPAQVNKKTNEIMNFDNTIRTKVWEIKAVQVLKLAPSDFNDLGLVDDYEDGYDSTVDAQEDLESQSYEDSDISPEEAYGGSR